MGFPVPEYSDLSRTLTIEPFAGTERGININSFESEDANLRVVYSFNQDAYMKLLIDIFSAEQNVCAKKK